MIKRSFAYFDKLINAESKESSKRFLALFTMLLVAVVVGFAVWKHENLITVLSILLSFVLALMGIASWQSYKVRKLDKENNEDDQLDDTAPMV